MNKILTTLLFAIASIFACHADQLSYLTRVNADRAIKYLNANHVTELLILNACSDKPEPIIYKIDRLYADFTGIQNYFQVCLLTSELRVVKLDLAYVFIAEADGKYKNLGKILHYDCFPCIEDGFTLKEGKLKDANITPLSE